MPEVRRATASDVGPLAVALARAFQDDPVAVFLFPEAARRPQGLLRFFKMQLRRTYLRRGEVYTTIDCQGGALWMPPGSGHAGVRESFGQFELIPLLGRRLMPTLRLLALMESHHPKNEHYYLGPLGTDPQWQGTGVGSAMLGPVLERCDQEAIPAYLESSNSRNVPFFRRHGFEVSGELRPLDAPPLCLMWREPALRG